VSGEEGGEAPCWAHLFEDDADREPATRGATPPLQREPPGHPPVRAAALMAGIVAVLMVVSILSVR
jgi:hypothetical protein